MTQTTKLLALKLRILVRVQVLGRGGWLVGGDTRAGPMAPVRRLCRGSKFVGRKFGVVWVLTHLVTAAACSIGRDGEKETFQFGTVASVQESQLKRRSCSNYCRKKQINMSEGSYTFDKSDMLNGRLTNQTARY